MLRALGERMGAVPRILLQGLAIDTPDPAAPGIAGPAMGRFLILGELARGGIGVVLRGRDQDLGRPVALKILHEEFADRPDMLQRFVEEAQIGGQLQHPGIVPVYELGLQPDGRPFFAMKLVKGRTLTDLLAERGDPSRDRQRFLSILLSCAQTVAYAHGVIHRDLKPSNIMVGAFGEVLVLDWGLGKVLGHPGPDREPERPVPEATIIATVRTGSTSTHSVAGSVLGTPQYMPPEQARGAVDSLDARSDVFSFGAVLCEVLTGAPPYGKEGPENLVRAARADQAEALARLESSCADAELIALARDCLAPAPAARPKDAGEVAARLGAYLASVEERARSAQVAASEARAREAEEKARAEHEKGEAAKARAESDLERQRAEAQRRAKRLTVALSFIVLLAMAGGAAAWVGSTREAARRQREAEDRLAAAMDDAVVAKDRAVASQDPAAWQEAVVAADRAAEVARDPGVAAEARARAETLKTDAGRAAAVAREAAADDGRGIELGRKDDLDGAVAAFREALRLVPGKASFHHHLANACLRKGMRTEAVAAYRAAVAASSRDWALRADLVRALYESGDFRDLEAAVVEAAGLGRLQPDTAESHFYLGNARMNAGDYDGAETAFQEALRYRPGWASPLTNLKVLGTMRANLGILEESLQGEPESRPAGQWVQLGEFAYKVRRFRAAADCFDRAIRTGGPQAEDPRAALRYNGACAAALAAEGRGLDAGDLAPGIRMELRARARALLEADVAAWEGLFVAAGKVLPQGAQEMLPHFLEDRDLASIQEPESLKALPPEEAVALKILWARVRKLVDRIPR